MSFMQGQTPDGKFRDVALDASGAVKIAPGTAGAQPSAGSQSITPATDATFPTNPVAASAATVATVGASVASVLILAANANRKGAVIVNDSTATLYLVFGPGPASAGAFTVRLNPGDTFSLGRGDYAGAIQGIWSAAAGAARVTEVA